MLNLLKNELHDRYPGLYNRAVDQWIKVVGGGTILFVDSLFVYGAAETGDKGITTFAGGLAVLGAGLAGYGLGQLSETSRQFDEALQARQSDIQHSSA